MFLFAAFVLSLATANPLSTDPLPRETAALHSWFRDVTENSGVRFTYRNGEEADHYAILETLGAEVISKGSRSALHPRRGCGQLRS
jgi:hypothetical protein